MFAEKQVKILLIYPKIGDPNFKGALRTLKQQLNFYSSPINVFVLYISGHVLDYKM